MDWSSIGNIIGGAAPLLGSLIGGPIGGAAGALVASLFGVENTPEAISKAITDDPDAMLKLKTLESQNQATLLQWHSEQHRLLVEDRVSARTASVEGGDRKQLMWLTIFICAMAFIMEFAIIMFGFADKVSGELAGRVLGTLDTLAITSVAFWFGGSPTPLPTHSEIQKLTKG